MDTVCFPFKLTNLLNQSLYLFLSRSILLCISNTNITIQPYNALWRHSTSHRVNSHDADTNMEAL